MTSKKLGVTLEEMFVIYTISKKVEFVSHKLGLKKLISQYMGNNHFCRLIEIEDLMAANNQKIRFKYAAETEKVRKKLGELNQSEMPEAAKLALTALNLKIIKEQNDTNKEISDEFNTLTDNKKEYLFEMNPLAKNAIISLVSKENLKVADLGLTEHGFNALATLCEKLEM